MFWVKRFKRNIPEEFLNKKKVEVENIKLNFKTFKYITEAILKALMPKENLLAREIIYKAKNNEGFFKEFMKFLERDKDRRKLLQILKRKIE